MAEQAQPKKGSTSKFSDTLGKMDALIYNALGINVKSLLNALGIKSLLDLKNLKWANINWSALLSILYMLNPTQLKSLLTRMNLAGFNISSLLRAFGVNEELILLYEYVKSVKAQSSSGIFTGGASTLGIDGTWESSRGWLPGDDEAIIMEMMASGNLPTTGIKLNLPDDPTDPKFMPYGSENVLNVLSDCEDAGDVIQAMTPAKGIGEFYYEYIDTPVRFDSSKFIPWSEVGGYDILRSNFCQRLGEIPSYSDFMITNEEGRVDLIANSIFEGTYNPEQYWWIILMYNGIYSLDELKSGTTLKAPKLADLEDLYFKVKTLGED